EQGQVLRLGTEVKLFQLLVGHGSGLRDDGIARGVFRCFRVVQDLGRRFADALKRNQVEGVALAVGIRAGHKVPNIGEIEGQQGNQNEDAAEQGEQEELDGGILAARAAPHADEEIHRQQHHLPEDIEQEEVERQEGDDHDRLEDQEQHAVGAHTKIDAPASDYGLEVKYGRQ